MSFYLLKAHAIQHPWPFMGAISAGVTAASFGLLMLYKGKETYAGTNKHRKKSDVSKIEKTRVTYYNDS